METILIASVCHEANRAYCLTQGDTSQLPWTDAPEWQRSSAMLGVQKAIEGATPEQLHESWCAQKVADGWTVGAVKDADAKTHPCLVRPNSRGRTHFFRPSSTRSGRSSQHGVGEQGQRRRLTDVVIHQQRRRKMHNDTARRSWFDRLLQREEMDGDGRCATYLVRWTLLKWWGGRGLYLHHFVGDDWSKDLHDHPKRFVSIGLKGEYVEETPAMSMHRFEPLRTMPDNCSVCGWPYARHVATVARLFRAPWIRTFDADHIHRIRLVNGAPCWTLVIVLRTRRPWGFWHAGEWVPWRKYVNSETATRMKSCP